MNTKSKEVQPRQHSTQDHNHSGFLPASQGQRLDSESRSVLEPRFGHNFGDVRVFADGQADQLAQSYNARAFAVGQDVYFKNGEYNPNSVSGMGLLAHELTHTIQQRDAKLGDKAMNVSQSNDASEQEAASASSQVMAGQSVSVAVTSDAMIARFEDDGRQASFSDPENLLCEDPLQSTEPDIESTGDEWEVPSIDPLGWVAKQALKAVLKKGTGVPGGIVLGAAGMESDESQMQREARKNWENEQGAAWEKEHAK